MSTHDAAPDVRLRTATAHDAPFLVDMLLAAANWEPSRDAVSRTHLLADRGTARYVDGWPRAGDHGVIAEAPTGEPLGAAWLRLFPADDAGYGFLSADVPELSLGVVARWRGRGVGRGLLRELVARARTAGHRRLSLSVERANRARELYRAEGFVTVASGQDADTMLLDLTTASPPTRADDRRR